MSGCSRQARGEGRARSALEGRRAPAPRLPTTRVARLASAPTTLKPATANAGLVWCLQQHRKATSTARMPARSPPRRPQPARWPIIRLARPISQSRQLAGLTTRDQGGEGTTRLAVQTVGGRARHCRAVAAAREGRGGGGAWSRGGALLGRGETRATDLAGAVARGRALWAGEQLRRRSLTLSQRPGGAQRRLEGRPRLSPLQRMPPPSTDSDMPPAGPPRACRAELRAHDQAARREGNEPTHGAWHPCPSAHTCRTSRPRSWPQSHR